MRGEHVKAFLAGNYFAVCPSFLEMVVDTVNAGDIKSETINDVTPSHSYEVRGNLAIISIDGAMTKKNTFVNALCGGFASYDIIDQYITKAENDSAVDTILFNVDTPGGEVAGVDEVGELIYASTKHTVTFYNNLGASAGIWAFSSSKEIYANETALLGSIGVIAGYRQSGSGDGSVSIVSKNAKNKTCALNGDCAERIQARIDSLEEIFYSRVMRNTGFSAEQISKGFDFGSIITASEAQKMGFIKGITTLNSLINSLVKGATMPATEAKIASNSTEGTPMEFTQANFEALLAERDTLRATLEAAVAEGQNAMAEATAQAAERDAAIQAETETRVREALAVGVDAETAIAMLNAESAEAASAIALTFKQSQGGTQQGEAEAPVVTESAILKYAQSNKGAIK